MRYLSFIFIVLTCTAVLTGCGGSQSPVDSGIVQDSNANTITFSPYKDATLYYTWAPVNTIKTGVTAVSGTSVALQGVLENAGVETITLGFATGACGSEVWGTASATNMAASIRNELSTVKYIIATGGLNGAFTCSDVNAFQAFIDNYKTANLAGIDLDIEAGYTNESAAQLVASAASFLKSTSDSVYKNLPLSITLATVADSTSTQASINGLGVAALNALLSSGYENYVVNLMVMDYNPIIASNCVLNTQGSCDMGQSAIQAATNLHAKYNIPYSHIALTPMIGDNDTAGEVFTLDDVSAVKTFVEQNGLSGLHFWAFDRDTPCDPKTTSASPLCNNEASNALDFTKAFLTN